MSFFVFFRAKKRSGEIRQFRKSFFISCQFLKKNSFFCQKSAEISRFFVDFSVISKTNLQICLLATCRGLSDFEKFFDAEGAISAFFWQKKQQKIAKTTSFFQFLKKNKVRNFSKSANASSIVSMSQEFSGAKKTFRHFFDKKNFGKSLLWAPPEDLGHGKGRPHNEIGVKPKLSVFLRDVKKGVQKRPSFQ